MRCGVDTDGQTADDRDTHPSKLARNDACHFDPIRCGVSSSNDSYRVAIVRTEVSADIYNCGCIVRFSQLIGVLLRAQMYRPNAAPDEPVHLLIGIHLVSFGIDVFNQRRTDARVTQLPTFRPPCVLQTAEVCLHSVEALRSHSIDAVKGNPIFQIVHSVTRPCLRVHNTEVVPTSLGTAATGVPNCQPRFTLLHARRVIRFRMTQIVQG